MQKILLISILTFFSLCTTAQSKILLNNNWKFRQAGTSKWMQATVPGSVYTDLLKNKKIPAPFFADNERKIQWVDTVDWEYSTIFFLKKTDLKNAVQILTFDGLDTYADVYINGQKLFSANNMFRPWEAFVNDYLRLGKNEISVYFHAAKKHVDSIAKTNLPLVLPDNNRLYARKAQYQFGWDWGPIFIGCGIWKNVSLIMHKNPIWDEEVIGEADPIAKLIMKKDDKGESFYFEKNGKPVYCKGANWIPSNIFLPTKKEDYRKLLLLAREADVNMLRVWGGGIYEDEYFYELCDSLGIMIWQDFMFAGAMVPGDHSFFENVKEEVRYQVNRLKRYSCIVLWCGNNEIDEAFNHWGWQKQFNLHGNDSAKVWHDYTRLFRDSIKNWVEAFDGRRPYVSTSPRYGWGNPKSYAEGDSHYWGLWWGLADWESWETKTGRFISEFGMQSMSNYESIKSYTPPNERFLQSNAVRWHQKAGNGFTKINHYVNKYFFDTTLLYKLNLEEYTYLTQAMQYYILKNSFATQIKQQPYNMGTLVWQWNDCWPVASWSVTDFNRSPKAGYYALKKVFTTMDTTRDTIYPKYLQLQQPLITITKIGNTAISIKSDKDARYVQVYSPAGPLELSDNYIDLKANIPVVLQLKSSLQSTPFVLKTRSLYDIFSK